MHEANWGMRKMAYEIEQARVEADYRFFRFTGGKDLLDDLDHSLRITDGVLRFRIFKVDARLAEHRPARHRADHAPRRGRPRARPWPRP